METGATPIFEAGLQRAEKAYEEAFEEAKGGIGTWLTTWGSDWEKHIEKSLATARNEYLKQVDKAIDEVADFVEAKLKAAKQRVADGRKEVEDFVKGLDSNLKQYGEEALQAVSADFDAMGTDIDQRRDSLIDKLAQQYKASYERMSAMEEKLREENKSLWQRVYDATVGIIKKIIAFKDMLLSILAKAAEIIVDIIAHPIRFLGNLVSGIMQGLKNFMAKIEFYLQKGLMEWLFGALGAIGLQLPDKFDLQGIISIVLQILGLTYASFRARAVALVGEPVVAALEKTADIFKVVITEGVPGLWRFIKEQLADLKSTVLDAILGFVKERVIMAGITWIIGLLNPVSAFFKACKAIYDIVVFFINRASQIAALVSAIVDSIAAIAKGALGTAMGLVEGALAKAIPVAIGFLASLLSLGDPSKPVRGFIEKARAPVNKAIDWVINLAVKGVKMAGKMIGELFGKKDDKATGKAEDLKWNAGVTGVRTEMAEMEKTGPVTTKALELAIPGWKRKYGFTSLRIDADQAKWTVLGSMSLERIVEEHTAMPPAEFKDLQTEVDYYFPEATAKGKDGQIINVGEFLKLRMLNGEWWIVYLPTKRKHGASGAIEVMTRAFKKGTAEKSYVRAGTPGTIVPTLHKGTGPSGRASWVHAQPLALQESYTAPGKVSPHAWTRLGSTANWERAHLINGKMGGPASTWNLVPTPIAVNKAMAVGHENPIRQDLKKGKYFYFGADVEYYDDTDSKDFGKASDFVRRISVSYGETELIPPDLKTFKDSPIEPKTKSYSVRLPVVAELDPKRRAD